MIKKIEANFVYNPYPYRYVAKYQNESWSESLEELPHNSPQEEKALSPEEYKKLLLSRNNASGFPLVNYTTQYGLGCFEGLKAFTQKNNTLALFRVGDNATRFYNSMKGLLMTPFPEEMFLNAVTTYIKKLFDNGLFPKYNTEWEENNFLSAPSIYIRPFTYSEGGIGVNISTSPWVIIVSTEIGNYFAIEECPGLLVSDKVRATPNGTGWIKTAANYLIPVLAKKEAINQGYAESLFLDSKHNLYVEECSSCNIFFVLKNNTIVTPTLGDTILPGITRDSIIKLLSSKGYTIEERLISIDEVFDSAVECFTTGTAVGVSHFGKLTYKDSTIIFGNEGKIGPITKELQILLKKIQYGCEKDSFNWITHI